MSVQQQRQEGGGGYQNWPSPQITHNEEWVSKYVDRYPNLGDGFVVPVVYRPSNPGEEYKFTIDMPSWSVIFDRWFIPGQSVMITGDLFLDVRIVEHLEDFDPTAGEVFAGYRKPSKKRADVKDQVVQIKQVLSGNDNQMGFNIWAIVEFGGQQWRARFKKADAENIQSGQWYKVGYNRRIDVHEFIAKDFDPSDEQVPF